MKRLLFIIILFFYFIDINGQKIDSIIVQKVDFDILTAFAVDSISFYNTFDISSEVKIVTLKDKYIIDKFEMFINNARRRKKRVIDVRVVITLYYNNYNEYILLDRFCFSKNNICYSVTPELKIFIDNL